jgi:hypothetical protein
MKKYIIAIILGGIILPISAFAAISHSTSHGINSGSGTSVSLASVAPTGSDRLLVCSIVAGANGTTVSTGPSFGGSNFTQLGSYVDIDDGGQSFSVWYLISPTTSSGSVTATLSASTEWQIWCDSYTGVNQTSPFANVTTGGHTPSYITTTPTNVTRTSNTNGSWHFTSAQEASGATALTISSGGIRREGGLGTTVTLAHFDSNTSINNGNDNTMTLNWTGGGQHMGYITAMILPSGSEPIIGSGIANRLAKFTASNTIANALLSDDGSNTTLTSGDLFFQPGILLDTVSSGAINIGSTTATSVNIGQPSGNITLLGPATFQNFTALTATTTSFISSAANIQSLIFTTAVGTSATTTNLTVGSLKTASNCSSSASPALCGSASAGSVAMATGGSTLVVNTTAVTANSQIMITEDSSLSARLGITCNTVTGRDYTISARTAGTSFTIKSSANPTTNKACLSYWIVN